MAIMHKKGMMGILKGIEDILGRKTEVVEGAALLSV
jgi:hypothetical protein